MDDKKHSQSSLFDSIVHLPNYQAVVNTINHDSSSSPATKNQLSLSKNTMDHFPEAKKDEEIN